MGHLKIHRHLFWSQHAIFPSVGAFDLAAKGVPLLASSYCAGKHSLRVCCTNQTHPLCHRSNDHLMVVTNMRRRIWILIMPCSFSRHYVTRREQLADCDIRDHGWFVWENYNWLSFSLKKKKKPSEHSRATIIWLPRLLLMQFHRFSSGCGPIVWDAFSQCKRFLQHVLTWSGGMFPKSLNLIHLSIWTEPIKDDWRKKHKGDWTNI